MKIIVGAAIGNCVHVGGLHHFLKLAEAEGYRTISLGPAVPVNRIIRIIKEEKPDITALSYRLTPDTASELFKNLKEELQREKLQNTRMIFGGTPPVAAEAARSGLFEKVFDGTEKKVSLGSRCLCGRFKFVDHDA